MSYDFSEIIDLPTTRQLIDSLWRMTGLPVSILNAEGDIMSMSGRPQICATFHREYPEQPQHCFPREIFAAGSNQRIFAEGWREFKCDTGLVGLGSPIILEGQQVATVVVGPILYEPADPALFAGRAEQLGFDPDNFLAELAEVPVVSAAQVRVVLGFFANLVKILSDLALQSMMHEDARRAAERSESKFRDIFTSSSDGIVITDLDGRVLEANPAMCDLLGYESDIFLRGTLTDYVGSQYVKRIADRLRKVVADGQMLFETSLKHRLGHEIPAEIRGQLITFDDSQAILGQVRDLSQRQQTERALRESEERFRGIFEDAGIGMVLTRRDGRFIQVNPEFCRFLGYTRDELLAKTMDDVTCPADRHLLKQFSPETLNGERSVINAEKRYLHKEGFPVWGRVTALYRIFEADLSTVSVTMIQDITAEKNAQQAVEASEATLKSILMAAPMSIGLVRKRVICWVNRWMIDEMGYAETELIGQSARMLYDSDAEFERVGEVKYADLAKGKMGEVLTCMRCKDGRLIDVLLRSTPINPENVDEGVIFTASNITELIHAETELRKALDATESARQQINTIFRSVTAGLIVVDQSGHIQMVNPAVEKLLSLGADQLVGSPVAEFLAVPEFLERVSLALAGDEKPEAVQLNLAVGAKPEKLFLQVKVVSLKEAKDGVTGALAVLRDVTREHEINLMKDEFISTAAHELRTPMTSILGYTELMLERIEQFDTDQLRDFLRVVFDRSEALSQIISDMLDLSRVQSGRLISLEKFPGDLCQLLDQIAPSYEYNDSQCQVIINRAEGLPLLMFDPHKMTQVFDNLLSNAVKFSPAGGKIRVSLQHGPDGVVVSVRDQGLGMSAEQQERIFDKFYRADHSNTAVSGLGLGMSLVKSIIEGHGGRVWVESEPGSGTTVSFTVPDIARQEDGTK